MFMLIAAHRTSSRVFGGSVIMAWLLFVTLVYVPDIGRGFVKDAFGWVEQGRAALAHPGDVILSPRPGFYRPLVTLTFAVDYALHGHRPRPYGFTNLLLYGACVTSVSLLLYCVGI